MGPHPLLLHRLGRHDEYGLATSYYSLVQEALGPRGNTLGTIISRMSAAGGGRSKAEPIEQESARKAPWGRRRATIANCGVLIKKKASKGRFS